MVMPATTLSTMRRWSSSGASEAHDFSLMRLPSSRMQTPPWTIAVTSGEAMYRTPPSGPSTGVTSRSSGRVSMVAWTMKIVALELPGRGAGEGGLADPRLAEQPRVERRVVFGEEGPCGEQLEQDLPLADPGWDLDHRPCQMEFDAVDLENGVQAHRTSFSRKGHFTASGEWGP